VTWTGSAPTARERPRWLQQLARWSPHLTLFAFAFVVLIPTWIVLPPDDEGLFTAIAPTVFQSNHLVADYPFWNPFIGFGVPHPGSESLIFHPFVLIAHVGWLGASIPLLYQVQLWLALISVWAICRHLGMQTWLSAVCAATYALSSATITLLENFWPDVMVAWTLSPLLLLLILKLLDAGRRQARVFYGVSAGLCAALMILDGHAGVFPAFAVAFVGFLIGAHRRARRVWPWLGVALIVLAAGAGTRIFDIALETARSSSHHFQQSYRFSFPYFFLYPHFATIHGARNVAFGAPFAVLALLGLFWPNALRQHLWGFRLAVGASFLAWFMPVHWIPALSGNWFFGQPLTLFAIVLAGLTLQRLWERFPRYRWGWLALGAAQIGILVWGFSGFYRDELQRAQDFSDGNQVPTLKNTFENHAIYRYFEQQPDRASTRVLMAPHARERLWRTMTDYAWPAWAWHGLRLVNGHFRGDDVGEFEKAPIALHGEIRGDKSVWPGVADGLHRNASVLDVLNVGYVLAGPGDSVVKSLVPVRRFRVPDPNPTVITAYRNPDHWPDAAVLANTAKGVDTFSKRAGCDIPGLLCDDLSPVLLLRRPGAITSQRWDGLTLDVRLAPMVRPGVLMVSQLYRPGWRARLSDGRTVDGYRLFGAVTAFDLPAGTRSARIYFHPTARILFAGLSWAVVLLGLAFVAVTAALGWSVDRDRRGATSRTD
jgi:hypothetical protein